MGIPRLTQDLFDYTEIAVLNAECEVNDDEFLASKIVIDGPSLVYYVYDSLVRRMTPLDIASASMPTYSNVIAGVRSFIEVLQIRGVTIEAVLFDGDLPTSKRGVRLERTEKTRKQLEDFRQSHPELRAFESRAIPLTKSTGDARSTSVSSVRYALPPQPFLVPAVIEAVRVSGDMGDVRVVPEEADVACARIAKASGAAILTNDSDLALYDLGPNGCVLVLRSLTGQDTKDPETSKPANGFDKDGRQGDSRLFASSLRPVQISQRLGLPSLLDLGFERFLDPSVSTSTIIKRARKSSMSGKPKPGFQEFQKEFDITELVTASRPLDILDPRISEFIMQASESSEAPHVYLPILYEDPSRDSSWEYGLAFRQLAYSIFYSTRQQNVSGNVIEYGRKGARIAETSKSILTDNELLKAAQSVLQSFEGIFEISFSAESKLGSSLCPTSVPEWHAAALLIVLQHKLDNSKSPFSRNSIDRLFGISTNVSVNSTFTPKWEDLHLLANSHAVMYSWRMLRQIIDWTYESCTSGEDQQRNALLENIVELRSFLKAMPACGELFLTLKELRVLGTTETRQNSANIVKRALSRHWDEQSDVATHEDRDGSRKKRMKMSASTGVKGSAGGWSKGNAFGVLGLEDDGDG